MLSLEEHLRTTHDFVEALRTLYPEKKTSQAPKKDKAEDKDTKK